MKLNAIVLASSALFVGGLFASVAAHADPNPCTNDIMCTDHGSACGTDVCIWPGQKCGAPSTDPSPAGMQGWCAADTDCKCMGAGARCVAPHCTFVSTGGTTSGGPSDAATTSSGGSDAGTTKPASSSSSGCSYGGPGTSAGAWFAGALGACLVAGRRRRRTS